QELDGGQGRLRLAAPGPGAGRGDGRAGPREGRQAAGPEVRLAADHPARWLPGRLLIGVLPASPRGVCGTGTCYRFVTSRPVVNRRPTRQLQSASRIIVSQTRVTSPSDVRQRLARTCLPREWLMRLTGLHLRSSNVSPRQRRFRLEELEPRLTPDA